MIIKLLGRKKGEFNLEEHLSDVVGVCRDVMKDIENKFGKTVLHDKMFVEGVSSKFLVAVEGKVGNNVEVGRELRLYRNCLGYLIS